MIGTKKFSFFVIIILLLSYFLYKRYEKNKKIIPVILRNRFNIPKKLNEFSLTLGNYLFDMCWYVTMYNKNHIFKEGYEFFDLNDELTIVDDRYFNGTKLVKIFTRNDDTIIVFSGSIYLISWLDNINIFLVECTKLNNYKEGMRVHNGLYNVYLQVRDKIWEWWNNNRDPKKNNKLIITGHSSGGVLSNLCSLDFAKSATIINYTFGSPKVGNKMFGVVYDKLVPYSMRVNNIFDNIINFPPPTFFEQDYVHVGNNISFSRKLEKQLYNHIDSYRELAYIYK